MPAFERAQHLAIFDEIDVVRNLGRVVDVLNGHGNFFLSCSAANLSIVMPAQAGIQ
jgi:predicted AAA+ superfamily ATPase